MAITKLTVENFKSFDKLEVELRPFNIVVGSNASGKSTFLDVFRFLRDIAEDSLESAIGIRGGGEMLRNFNLDENQVLRICVETDDAQRLVLSVQQDSAIVTEINRTAYEFSIRYDKSDSGYQVLKDSLTEYFTMLETLPMADLVGPEAEPPLSRVLRPEVWDPDTYEVLRSFGDGRTLYYREDNSIKRRAELPPNLPYTKQELSIDHVDIWNVHRHQEVMLEQLPAVNELLL